MGAHYSKTPLDSTPMQELANCFCIKSQTTNILDTGPYVFVATTQVFHCRTQAATDGMSTSEYGYVPIKLASCPLKFVLHIIFMCHNISSF